MLHIKNLRIEFDEFILIDNISFDVVPGEVLAITGPNGCGKTSLIRAIKGELPYEGTVFVEKGKKIAFVPQENPESNERVVEFILQEFPEIHRIKKLLESQVDDPLICANLLDEYAGMSGFELEDRIVRELLRLGFGRQELEKSVSDFSEGEKRLLLVTRAILKDPDLIILDEPTNHLDISMIMRLEEEILRLKKSGKAFIVISHDRTFVDKIADRTLFIQRGKAVTVRGGFSLMRAHLQNKFESDLRRAQEISRKIRQLEQEVARRKEWSRKKESQKKFADKVMNKGYIGRKSAKLAKRARAVEKRVEELIDKLKAEKPFIEKRLKMLFPYYEVAERKLLSCENLSFSYDTKDLFSDINLDLTTKDRAAIVGPNGTGKTTLLKCLIGALKPKTGQIYMNKNVNWVYLPQRIETFFQKEILLDTFMVFGISETEIRTILGAAKFRREKVFQRVDTLSKGELTRAAIVWATLSKAEFLFMDEPTNHLDIESLEVLDVLIENFKGGMLFISHDRHFISRHAREVYYLSDKKLSRMNL
ncbi:MULTISPECIES: ABC-F family ATP-binding cassette domain-containing protein [Kosmotoga]|uniref:ABC transporter related n=1 Tax=Kosmotoga olearia (strain ATCC BAA-1733 / DSM 21960 / TBF 19.5.1) TaxID=521045 RepID=C5CGJ6_KOSOT|nr:MULTISPECIES: ABC-F family ATP-binding cassette domain-containing protein [Kosmotoga]ACR79578.1 ABC transporter related [Kosmotoga olearia TBF 19.5.1]MDI3523908.1 ATP-binding cassette, subfamily er 3 [Kosmotoga sp.]MDK2953313.1 ATP-binding cassette, subfamily er 3 [Kosmotoga sp.]